LVRTITYLPYSSIELSSCRNLARSYTGWLPESGINIVADEPYPTGWWAISSDEYADCGDRVPQRHMEAYQQVPPVEIQPVHRQEAKAY
jgi:hypothetical protein